MSKRGYGFIGAPWGKAGFLERQRRKGYIPRLSKSPWLSKWRHDQDFLVGNGGLSAPHPVLPAYSDAIHPPCI